MTPAWILDTLAALMLAVAAVSAARLALAPRRTAVLTGVDVAHLLMAIAMAGMLVASLATLPDGAWEVVFGLLTAWFAYQVVRDARASGIRALAGGHCAPHLVHSAAMLYMFLALSAPAAGTGMMGASATQTLRLPTVAFVFALILVGYCIWDLDQLSGKRYSLTTARMSLAGTAPAGIATLAGSSAAAFSGVPSADGPATASADPASVAAATGTGTADGDGTGREPRGVLLSPGMTVGCRIVMGIAMAFMLLIMI